MASVVSSLRYLLADFIGEDDGARPFLPEGLPAAVVPVVSEGIDLLMEYQGSSYAQFYVDRVRRFVGRRGVDERMLGEIARLMALRMSYQDPIRIAQLKLMEFEAAVHGQRNATDDLLGIFRVDELIGALPAAIAEPVLDVLERLGWTHAPVSIRFSSKSRWGVRRLKIESSLRRWRLFSVRYAKERAWVERWLHMIGRSLEKQPAAASAIVQTATMIQGYGDGTARALPTGTRSSTVSSSRHSTACCRSRISRPRWRRPEPPPCPIRGSSLSSAPWRRSGRVRLRHRPTPRRDDRVFRVGTSAPTRCRLQVPGLLPCRAAPSAGANLNASKRTIIFRLSTVLLDSKSGRAGRVTAKPTSLLRCQQRATPHDFLRSVRCILVREMS